MGTQLCPANDCMVTSSDHSISSLRYSVDNNALWAIQNHDAAYASRLATKDMIDRSRDQDGHGPYIRPTKSKNLDRSFGTKSRRGEIENGRVPWLLITVCVAGWGMVVLVLAIYVRKKVRARRKSGVVAPRGRGENAV